MPLVSFVLQLETSEHAQAYQLLHLFAYGTLPEYNSEPSLDRCPVLQFAVSMSLALAHPHCDKPALIPSQVEGQAYRPSMTSSA